LTIQDSHSENFLKLIGIAKGTIDPQHMKNCLQIRGVGFMGDRTSITISHMGIVVEFKYLGGIIKENGKSYEFTWPFALVEEK